MVWDTWFILALCAGDSLFILPLAVWDTQTLPLSAGDQTVWDTGYTVSVCWE